MHTAFLTVTFFLFAVFGVTHAYAQQTAAAPSVPLIQPAELADMQSDSNLVILDTRSLEEYQEGHLENARFVNYDTFTLNEVADLSKDQKIVVYCKAGGRGNNVAKQLIEAGYKRVKNLQGGILHWEEEGYETTHE